MNVKLFCMPVGFWEKRKGNTRINGNDDAPNDGDDDGC